MRSVRIDSVSFNEDDSVDVAYTAGTPPLGNASGNGQHFASKAELAAVIASVEQNFPESQLAMIALSGWYRNDPNMSDGATAAGKAVTIDFVGSSSPFSLT